MLIERDRDAGCSMDNILHLFPKEDVLCTLNE